MASKRSTPEEKANASAMIDRRIAELDDWRGEALARVRALFHEALPGVVEEWKWAVPVWSHDGIICTGESYKQAVKLTFPKGASLPDPSGLFNSSLEGNTRRAIDIRQGEAIDARAFKALVRSAAELNAGGGAQPKTAKAKTAKAKAVKLLAGGNPQIPKGEGDAPVQAYIAAIPGWKRAIGERLDALIERAVPGVRKAVKWNSPFYGVEGKGYFLSYHIYDRYVKVAFFRGVDLKPVPPDPSKDKHVRYVNIHEGAFDPAQMEKWVRQAAKLPGWET